MLLASKELKHWRDSLLGTLAPASINRICNSMCAALELAAQHDPRIPIATPGKRARWTAGRAEGAQRRFLRRPGHAFVRAAYGRDGRLGLFIDRWQGLVRDRAKVTRLLVEDLHGLRRSRSSRCRSPAKAAAEIGARRRLERYSVPITVALSRKLKAAAKRAVQATRRCCCAPLWQALESRTQAGTIASPSARFSTDHRRGPRHGDALPRCAIAPIVRMLLKNIPIRLIAALHNTRRRPDRKKLLPRTSPKPIPTISRAPDCCPQPAPAADNVIPLR